jgi:hypothetical protein
VGYIKSETHVWKSVYRNEEFNENGAARLRRRDWTMGVNSEKLASKLPGQMQAT